MEDLRSRSCVDWRMQKPPQGAYGGGGAAPPGLYDLRCYSLSYASYEAPPVPKKGRNAGAGAASSRSSSFRNSWSLSDPEMQRKRRVAGYKMYAAEGKIKTSFRKSFKWLKDRYTVVVRGW
ncbi:unnamed protein product [Spirodela intermedia]|uniref:Uncharacterized protein n=2 Tax=Spirodela intermedia TaxID=51605 RepID=A0ABN7E9V5_SPIIN|nr:unnamed protein product [Spirodela intermedia]CAA7408769.1 unnamed protein product [Spirodela intermedia]